MAYIFASFGETFVHVTVFLVRKPFAKRDSWNEGED